MSLKICESFRRILFYHGRKFMASAWSRNSFRGVKSFEEIPEALSVPLLGTMPHFDTAGGLTYLQKVVDFHHKALGPIFRANFDGNNIIFVSDADANVLIVQAEGNYPKSATLEAWRLYMVETGKRRGLFFMDDESWYKARSVFDKIILKQDSMACHVTSVYSVCHDLVEMWKISPPENLKHHICCWNVECIGEIAFGKNFKFVESLRHGNSKENIENREFVEVLQKVYLESAKLIGEVSIQKIKEKKAVPWIKFCEAMGKILQYGDSYVQKAIEDCQISKQTASIKKSIVYKGLNECLDEETLKGVITDIFLGSLDTTSNTALWALYLLGKNTDVANKARENISYVIEKESALNLSVATEIPYINGIIKEATRLYSPTPFKNRTLSIDAELCGYLVPAGNTVTSSLFTMGRDFENFTDPLKFQPERWFRKTSKYDQIVLKDHAPFASGARSCIGRKIAELELSLLLIKILTTFEWTVDEEVEPILRLATVPNKEFRLNFK